MLAITTVVASIVVSCKNKIGEAERLDLGRTPTQQTFDMFAVQTQNGTVGMRMEAPLMEHYDTDSASYDAFNIVSDDYIYDTGSNYKWNTSRIWKS